MARLPHLSGIAIDRGETDEGGDPPAIELAEFGQAGDQGSRGDIADAGHRCQEIVGAAPDGGATHGVVDFVIEFGELGLQGRQGGADGALDARRARLAQTVRFHADHFHHLTTAGDQFAQRLTVGIGDRAWFGANPLGKQGDDLSIEGIGLGEAPGGAREIPDLAWVDDGERQAGGGQSRSHGDLEPARSLEHDQIGCQIT